ncbi:TolC family protein [Vibrio astriarenae]|uniref:TolC family protein n=1 Tax=Vibrio astriarenae TaxID=1481923 RepID=UPI003735D98E
MFRHSIISIVLASIVGCASSTGIDYAREANNQSDQYLTELIEAHSVDSALYEQQSVTLLTDLIDIPELKPYLESALANNPSLQQSIIALQIAYAQQGVTRADQLPTVGASFSGETAKDNNESYGADVTVSWELDLWQKLADSSAAAAKDIAATQAQLQATKDLLAANMIRAWLDISVNQQLLDIELKRLAILENNEVLVLERYQVGLGSLEELDNAKTSTASTRATVAQYLESVQQSERSLLLLTGQWDADAESPDVTMAFPEILSPLSALSQQNMAGRPDLQQAFFNIEAETLRTDAAYKAMLPSFSLAASVADLAQTPSEALFTDPVWSVLGSISAPLFQGGKLKSQAEIAELTTEQSYWSYQDTLLQAVNEVENALGQETALEQQQNHLNDALESAHRSIVSYEEKYRQGLVDILDLLTVQQQAYDLQAQLASTTYQRLLNRVDLGLALGLGI